MEVHFIYPEDELFEREITFENNETIKGVEQKIRNEARDLCNEIRKELALDAIYSSEFRDLKITKE